MEENNIINILSDPEVSLDQKFYEYCKFYQEYITTPFNDSLEPVVSDAVQEFYPEFSELYDYFFSIGEVKEPTLPINEKYLNVSRMLSLKKDLEELVMPFGFISGSSISKKFIEIVNISKSSIITNFYTKDYLITSFRKAWKEVGVNRNEFWEGDLFYMSGGKICLVLVDLDNNRYIAVSSNYD